MKAQGSFLAAATSRAALTARAGQDGRRPGGAPVDRGADAAGQGNHGNQAGERVSGMLRAA
jgi:hypothetical protein